MHCVSQAGWKSWSQLSWLLLGFGSWSHFLAVHTFVSSIFFLCGLLPVSQTPEHEEQVSVFTLWTVSCSDVQEPTDRIIHWLGMLLSWFMVWQFSTLFPHSVQKSHYHCYSSITSIISEMFCPLNYFQYSKDTGHNLCCCIMNLQSEHQQIKVH